MGEKYKNNNKIESISRTTHISIQTSQLLLPPPLVRGLLHSIPLRSRKTRRRNSRRSQGRGRRRRRGALGRDRSKELRESSNRVGFHPQDRLEVGIDVFFVLRNGAFLDGGFTDGGGGQGDTNQFVLGADRADSWGALKRERERW